ncbi:putative membrane protein [Spinactinospora alkalitolerans]|uniref:Putative membrane protein n=1 Tax=Spinactinospora alkalitolerans TaxID=687207 RepID=A0A852TZJ3_9ACTN|nr:hypothetical protein [Spinactinospora alkalitolerans]NYE49348.1 putative membrane protein [Spinactinospora alkalitolerans]
MTATPRQDRTRGRPRPRTGSLPAFPRLSPAWRKTVLSAHVVASVGWLGAQVCLVTLLAAGLADDDPARVGAVYGAAGLLVSTLVAPVSLTALATGLVLSLGTPWGLARHWWVLIKLGLTALLVVGSNFSLGPQVLELAAATADGSVPPPLLERARTVIALSVALTVLLAATLLSTVKPFGRVRRRAGAPAARG